MEKQFSSYHFLLFIVTQKSLTKLEPTDRLLKPQSLRLTGEWISTAVSDASKRSPAMGSVRKKSGLLLSGVISPLDLDLENTAAPLRRWKCLVFRDWLES